MKRHATEPPDPRNPYLGLTLCKRVARDVTVDNAMPDCKRCLRVIAARLKREQ